MVKALDAKPAPPLIDHVGWRLWRLSRLWKARFDQEMVDLGHAFMIEARGGVVGHLRPGGASQASLARAMGVSKQAVQQLVDELVSEGIVTREPDPDDGRGKRVLLTGKGVKALEDSNRIKERIEADYAARLGKARFAVLLEALDVLTADEG